MDEESYKARKEGRRENRNEEGRRKAGRKKENGKKDSIISFMEGGKKKDKWKKLRQISKK
jgi:hypothetical protein